MKDNYDDIARKAFRLQRKISYYNQIFKKIGDVMDELNFSDWWDYAVLIDNDEFQRLNNYLTQSWSKNRYKVGRKELPIAFLYQLSEQYGIEKILNENLMSLEKKLGKGNIVSKIYEDRCLPPRISDETFNKCGKFYLWALINITRTIISSGDDKKIRMLVKNIGSLLHPNFIANALRLFRLIFFQLKEGSSESYKHNKTIYIRLKEFIENNNINALNSLYDDGYLEKDEDIPNEFSDQIKWIGRKYDILRNTLSDSKIAGFCKHEELSTYFYNGIRLYSKNFGNNGLAKIVGIEPDKFDLKHIWIEFLYNRYMYLFTDEEYKNNFYLIVNTLRKTKSYLRLNGSFKEFKKTKFPNEAIDDFQDEGQPMLLDDLQQRLENNEQELELDKFFEDIREFISFNNLSDKDLKKMHILLEVIFTRNFEESHIDISELLNLFELMKLYYSEQSKLYEKNAISLWAMLNTTFLPINIREKIVNVIQKSVLRLAAANSYKTFKENNPDAIDWIFYNQQNIFKYDDIISTRNFDKLRNINHSQNCYNFNLTKKQIEYLFKELIKRKYIDKRSKADDFAFALTGCPSDFKLQFSPINWIGDNKNSLAIFLGMLKQFDIQMSSWFWHKSMKLFLYKDEEFMAKQLSSPYGKYLNHPETRNRDWSIMEKIIEEVTKMSIS